MHQSDQKMHTGIYTLNVDQFLTLIICQAQLHLYLTQFKIKPYYLPNKRLLFLLFLSN